MVKKMENLLEKLKAPFPAENVHWRVGATTKDKSKAIPLAYLDARDVMQRLDDVFGLSGWQCRYPFKGCCEISVFVDGEWVTRSNGAGETQVEADKGQYSDAFKRAAVLFGIGQYLYDVPNVWMPINEYKKFEKDTINTLNEKLSAWQEKYFERRKAA